MNDDRPQQITINIEGQRPRLGQHPIDRGISTFLAWSLGIIVILMVAKAAFLGLLSIFF